MVDNSTETTKLNLKQEDFAQYFVITKNGELSAIKAGYSKHTAASAASRMLKIVKVRSRIDQLQKEANENLFLKATDVVKQLMSIGLSNMQDFIDEDGYLIKNINELPRSITAAIGEMTEIESYNAEGDLVGIKRKVKLRPTDQSNKLLLQKNG